MKRFGTFFYKAVWAVSAVLVFLYSYILTEWLQTTPRSMESLAALLVHDLLTPHRLPNGDIAFKANPFDTHDVLIQYFSLYAGSCLVLLLCFLRHLHQRKKCRSNRPGSQGCDQKPEVVSSK